MKIDSYFKTIKKEVKKVYDVAEKARSKGYDPKNKVEIPLAANLPDKVAGLISNKYPQLEGNKKFVNRLLDLEKKYGSLSPAVCLTIAEEVAKEKFCKFPDLRQGIDAGIRVALAYTTLGVVSSPIEGYTELKLRKTKKNEDYFSVFYSGPIRSAGGTAAAFSLVIIDYLREKFGYAKYDPTEEEIKRIETEIYDYHERITNLQYLPTKKELNFLAKNLPIQIDGEPSSKREVSNYKDLDRVETNRIRSGYCLVFGEGIAQKAPKILRKIRKLRKQGFELKSWDWLEEFVEVQKKAKKAKSSGGSAVYIKDLVAGRPVLSHPSRSGGFRLRYGRARNTGYSSLAIHPATMEILREFIAVGTQLKIEMPTKGTAVAACDSIEGPIVKLKNGAVRKLNTKEEAKNIQDSVEEIIYIGDMLVPYGDFANRNHKLMPPGYCEQEWFQQLKEKDSERIQEIDNIYDVDFSTACKISRRFKIPLHPRFIYYWSQIDYDSFLSFLDWVSKSKFDEKLIFPYNPKEKEEFSEAKRVLELLGIEHKISTENIVLNKQDSKGLFSNLGLGNNNLKEDVKELINEIKNKKGPKLNKDVLKIINSLSEYKIIDKAGTFIGGRMGRPEKAKLRKLKGSPNVLFPVGDEGGRMRSLNEAYKEGKVTSKFPNYYCEKCGKETIYPKCEACGSENKLKYYCPICKKEFYTGKCPEHDLGFSSKNKEIKIKEYFDRAIKKIGLLPSEIPPLIKGVKGTINKDNIPENLTKGFLRALFDLQVNKDGTIRFDATEMPLTHFKPKEVGTSVEKLRKLGYKKDIYGKKLKNNEQILEIFPQDIILPACPNSGKKKADEVFMAIADFIDTSLKRFYDLKPIHNIKDREDLVGNMVAAIAPHNCAAVAARIIGFSKTQTLLASPYVHAACRRDCDGDEFAVILLSDLLINFSKEYLPSHRGGTQDAPLVLNLRIRAGEVDDMIFDIDVERELPLELYKAAREMKNPGDIDIEQIGDRLGKKDEFKNLWYEYEVSDLNSGVLCSNYKRLSTMKEKIQEQMALAKELRAVDTADVARLIIGRHFIRDIRGNLRKFSQQVFRCSKCNSKYRRPPISGKCLRCGGRIIFTISEGSIVKYLEPAIQLSEKYDVPDYVAQSLKLTRDYIESIFGRDAEKQEAIEKWI